MGTRIAFDMDGTIYDLYGVKDWLPLLRAYQSEAYSIGNALVDMQELTTICESLQACGVKIDVITWLSRESTEDFDKASTKAKMQWLRKNFPIEFDSIQAVPYGVPKHKVAKKAKRMILIDDNEEILQEWETPKQRKVINAKTDFVQKLKELLRELEGE